MQTAPHPPNEAQRLERLRRFGVLDTLPQEAFDNITALASAICGTPIALISLVDEDRQWFKSRVGLDAKQTPRELAFCAHAINTPNDLMEVRDATQDERFCDNPLVTEAPDIRFYAGMPIVTDDGFALGTVCVIDRRSRRLTEVQKQALRSLASLVLTLLDNTQEHLEALAAQAKESRQRAAVQTAMAAAGLDLLSYVSSDYVYQYANQCYLKYWGKQTDEIVGHRIPDLMGESVFKTLIQPHFDKALRGEEVSYEAVIDFPGMGPRAMEVTYMPATNEGEQIVGVVVRAHDIHAIKQRNTQLREANALLEHRTLEQQRFIHIISHDLREPINTIINFAGLIADDPAIALPSHAQRYMGFVQSGGERIKTLLDDLLEFLHMDRHSLTLTEVDVSEVVNHVLQDLAATVARTGASITVEALPKVQGDATLLRVLIQNLVANALKFCPSHRKPVVLIGGREDAGQQVLTVTDNGIGIPSEQTEKVFEMFTRLNNKKDFAGSGLGLSICRRIVDLHHGQIAVTSTVGQGSRFEVTFPNHLLPSGVRTVHEHI